MTSLVLFYDEGAQGTTELGGGQASRLSLMEQLGEDYRPVLLTSEEGELAEEAQGRGIEVIVSDITRHMDRFQRSEMRINPVFLIRFVIDVCYAAWKFRDLIADQRPDIIHPNENLARLIAIIATRGADVPLVMHIDGEWEDGWVEWLMRELYLRSFDQLIAVSDAVAESFEMAGHRPANVTTIHPGIELARFETDETPRNPIGVPDGMVVLTMVGNLIPIKGHEYLLQALQELGRDDLYCLLVGTGHRRDELSEMVRRLDLEQQVEFLGFRSDVPEIYNITDISITPSISEAFPRVVLEAMAAGVPIVASDVGGIREAVIHEETGILVPACDSAELAKAIQTLADDSGLREEFGKRGRERVTEQFSFHTGVDQVETLYDELLTDRS